jgi:ABC-2 type transport system permease protein
MNLFLTFFFFELKFRAKSISTYIYFVIFLGLSFMAVSLEDWSFIGPGRVLLNGPFATIRQDFNLSIFGMLLLAGIFGPAILRDFQHDTYQLIFTKPISKLAYLAGRWAGSFVTCIGIFSGLIFGEVMGSMAPWADHTRLLPVTPALLKMYLTIFFDIPVLQIFFVGSLFFMVAALSRKIIVVYLQGVALFAVYLILLVSVISTRSLDRFLPSLFDPLGAVLIDTITRYWTVVEQNTLVLPWHGVFLYNRLLWVGVGMVSLAATYIFFPMSAEALTRRRSPKSKTVDEPETERPRMSSSLPVVGKTFSAATAARQLGSLLRLRLLNTVRELPFWAIVLLMIANTLIGGHFAGHQADQNVWPVTALMLNVVEGNSLLFLLIVGTMYAGELMWRERDTAFVQIHEALPFHESIDWASKALAICALETILLTVVMLCGILSQILAGYYRFELGQYFVELYVVTLPIVLAFVLFALVVQSLVSNKYIGHAIVVGAFLLPTFLIPAGYINRLYLFDTATDYTYSDMNGYGHFVQALFWSTSYWLLWSALLVVVALALSRRGSDSGMRPRAINARRTASILGPIAALFVLGIVAISGWYIYNTRVINHFLSDKDVRHLQAAYETKYKKFENILQPKILAVDCKVNMHPETRSFDASGSYTLVNRGAQPINEIHISTNREIVSEISFDRPATITLDDRKLSYRIYRLSQPLAPGDRMRLDFRVAHTTRGFRNNGELAELAYSGMFFDLSYFPNIGYDRGIEITNPVRRREEHLPPLEEMADRGDPHFKNVNLFTPSADWITYHAVVSTSGDQIAVSPGYLQKSWKENGRNFFEYSMGSTKIQDFYNFISARYAVKRDRYQNVNIEIYYDPKHGFDIDDFVAASKAGLDYYQRNYGPYQFAQYRILEFPRYRGFAQSFPNTVPFSEGIGFIGRVEKPEDIDMTYFVTLHELAHQWWGHQLVGGFVKGSNMMSESLAEYSALRVMEKKYGADNMRRFLKHELDGYLRGRAGETRHEPPIVLVQNEPYVWYQKGSMVLYALSDYIGEDKLNGALKSLIDKYKFAGPPYPDTRDFVAALRAATPPDLQYVITDMFDNITLYDNKITSAKVTETPDHKYKVSMVVSAKKFRADGAGNEKQQPLHDLIEVGVFSGSKDHEKPIHVEKRWLNQESTNVEFIVAQKPTRAGIDPYSKLIDRNPEDNLMNVD